MYCVLDVVGQVDYLVFHSDQTQKGGAIALAL